MQTHVVYLKLLKTWLISPATAWLSIMLRSTEHPGCCLCSKNGTALSEGSVMSLNHMSLLGFHEPSAHAEAASNKKKHSMRNCLSCMHAARHESRKVMHVENSELDLDVFCSVRTPYLVQQVPH